MTLASSRGTSNGPDWKDIASALFAFEYQEKCKVRISIEAAGTPEEEDLSIQAIAVQEGKSGLEVSTLASANAKCSATGLVRLEAQIFRLLYALDFQSAANEYLASLNQEQ